MVWFRLPWNDRWTVELYSGLVCCVACGNSHVAVVPMPPWAAAPPPCECPSCGAFGCLAVAEGKAGNVWRPG